MEKKEHIRSDLNFLRFVAISGVLLFHYRKVLPGGFLGVDIFFVLSGYLITGKIFCDLINSKFEFKKFFGSRIRRIFPAYLAMLFCCLSLQVMFYLPIDIVKTEKDLFSSCFCFSNIVYWRTISYWDLESSADLFVHTWSLGVEFQFYLVFPFILWLLFFWKRQLVLPACFAIAAISYFLSLPIIHHSPRAAFFLFPPRMWEFLVGGLLFLLKERIRIKQKYSLCINIIGLMLITLSYCIIDESLIYSGYFGLLPVLGTALVICNQNDWLCCYIYNICIFRWIGLMSYSIYLYHWPVFSIFEYLFFEISIYSYLIISFGVSSISFFFIERPYLLNKNRSSRIFKTVICIFLLIALHQCLLYFLKINKKNDEKDPRPIFSRLPDVILNSSELQVKLIGKTSLAPSFIVWGDSHAQCLSAGLDIVANNFEISGLVFSRGAYLPVVDSPIAANGLTLEETNTQTDAFIKFLIKTDIRNVILVGYWNHYYDRFPIFEFDEKLLNTMKIIKETGKNVFLLEDNPDFYPNDVARYAELKKKWPLIVPNRDFPIRELVVSNKLETITKKANCIFVDQFSQFEGKKCFDMVVRNGEIVYIDSNHLSMVGAIWSAENLMFNISRFGN